MAMFRPIPSPSAPPAYHCYRPRVDEAVPLLLPDGSSLPSVAELEGEGVTTPGTTSGSAITKRLASLWDHDDEEEDAVHCVLSLRVSPRAKLHHLLETESSSTTTDVPGGGHQLHLHGRVACTPRDGPDLALDFCAVHADRPDRRRRLLG
eukprot:TRINITY_DN22996_c0_g1_i1.p1 TRINITY_DN22996_c0_g1~~TRINITY_DN22996_c0_g1_i1.p1  ORF type:complete len:150 (+),score=2.40 TRINITY_DN22996_c0_g1_i1:75-524(+)